MAGGRFRQLGRKEEDTELPAPAKLPPPEVNRGSTQSEKISKYISGLGSNLSPEVGQYLPDWRPGTDYKSGVSAQKDLGGGALLELSHELDYLQWFFGNFTHRCQSFVRFPFCFIDLYLD